MTTKIIKKIMLTNVYLNKRNKNENLKKEFKEN